MTKKLIWQAFLLSSWLTSTLLFIDHAQGLKIELAADYLVMASLACLFEIVLLLPAPEIDEEDVSPHLMAQALRYRLQTFWRQCVMPPLTLMQQPPTRTTASLARGGEPNYKKKPTGVGQARSMTF